MSKPKLLKIKTSLTDLRGRLTVFEGNDPFKVKRTFWITSIPKSCHRGGHAHRRLEQFIIPLAGGCKIKAMAPSGEESFFRLNSEYVGLYVPPKYWLDIYDFDPRTVLLVLASDVYKKDDYIRDLDEFKSLV